MCNSSLDCAVNETCIANYCEIKSNKMSKDNETTRDELVSWIKESVEKERFETCKVNLTSIPEQSGGYSGNMAYATVVGTTKDNARKELHLIVKHGKKDVQHRTAYNTRIIFEREMYFYDNILPLYTAFQLEKGVKNIFDSVSKCFKTMLLDKTEAIVMEDLKKDGYEMYDRRKPLNLNHIKLILREYGKFHAISFAFRDQRNEEFKELLKNYSEVLKLFVSNKNFAKNIEKSVATACSILKERGELNLLERYQKIQEKGGAVAMLEILDAVESQSAVLHGDCWNNNYLFKYQADDPNSPTKVAILDWQVSKLHSPVLDLSNFFYIVSSKAELDHFSELLKVYYESFSSFLTQLGSDPQQLFPFSDLKRHWEKYSLHGVLLATLYLQMTVCDQDEIKDGMDNREEGDSLGGLLNIQCKNQSLFQDRLTAVIDHYYNCRF